MDLNSLTTNSPFGKAPAAGAPANGGGDGGLEFRGVFVDRGEFFFSIFDPASRKGMWVGLKEAGNPFTVQSYDQAKGTIAVDYQGRSMNVAIRESKVVALAASPVPLPAPGAMPGATGAGPVPTVAPAAAPEEAARLAQIAEEIRRRRAIRAQAMQQGPLAAPSPNAAPPPVSSAKP